MRTTSPRIPGRLAGLAAAALALSACSSSRAARVAPPPDAGLRSSLAAGDAARREGDLDRALAAYEDALRAAPESIPAHLRVISALEAEGRGSVARERYAARAAAAGASEADRVLAARLATDGSPPAVRRVYVEAARASPANPWWRLAIAEVDLAAAERWTARGAAARSAGDRPGAQEADAAADAALERARFAIDHAAERGPGIPEVDFYRGLLESLRGDLAVGSTARGAAYRAAAEAFQRAAQADPGMVDAWADLADSEQRAGRAAEALAAWVRVLSVAPSDADARDGAGLALHDLDRPLDAAEQYRASARLRPRDAAPLLNVGDSLAAASKWEDALAAYRRALERDPSVVEAHEKMGAVLERLGRLSEARAAYETYVDLGGSQAPAVKRRIEHVLRTQTAAAAGGGR
jgi:tetratricopeptide (TPR) repeat protein